MARRLNVLSADPVETVEEPARKAGGQKRLWLLIVLPLALVLVAAVTVFVVARFVGEDAKPEVTVSGEFGRQPQVEFPRGGGPEGKFAADTVVKGTGPQVADGDLVVANYVGYAWRKDGTNKLIGSSYQGSTPGAFPSWSLVPGLKRALTGVKTGSRVVAVIPPKDGYGAEGASRLQITGEDSLVYVLDVVATHAKGESVAGAPALSEEGLPGVGAGAVPTLTVPKTAAPGKLTVRTVKQGLGQPVRGGQLLAIQYVGALWRDGKVFSSSWTDGKVYATVIGAEQVIKAWDAAIVGQKVGSRLMVVAPPGDAYGAKDMKVKGLPTYGIKADDTLVYVIDILGAY